MGHFKHFILYRLLTDGSCASNVEDSEMMDISKIRSDLRLTSHEFHELEPNLTMVQIQEHHWHLARHMLLAFTITGKLKDK